MRILRGLDSRALACGCLVGVYETYGSQTVAIIDAKGSACPERAHRVNSPVDLQPEVQPEDLLRRGYPPSTIPTSKR